MAIQIYDRFEKAAQQINTFAMIEAKWYIMIIWNIK